MSKKRKLKVKIKNKNKNQNIIHIKIDNSKKTKSRSNQNQKQQNQPSTPSIVISQAPQQPQDNSYLHEMIRDLQTRNSQILSQPTQPIIINPPQDNSYLNEMIRNSERRNSHIPIPRSILMNNTTQTEQPSFANRLMKSANNALLNMVNNVGEPKIKEKHKSSISVGTQNDYEERKREETKKEDNKKNDEYENYLPEHDPSSFAYIARNYYNINNESSRNGLLRTVENSIETQSPLTENTREPQNNLLNDLQQESVIYDTPVREINNKLNEELKSIDDERSEISHSDISFPDEKRIERENVLQKIKDDDEGENVDNFFYNTIYKQKNFRSKSDYMSKKELKLFNKFKRKINPSSRITDAATYQAVFAFIDHENEKKLKTPKGKRN